MPSAKARPARSSPSSFAAPYALHDTELRASVVVALDGLKAQDIVCLDLSDKSSFADWMIIASGTSTRHVNSLSDAVTLALARQGHPAYGVEGKNGAEWVCVDAGGLVIHLFTPACREHYRLEKLWSFPSLV